MLKLYIIGIFILIIAILANGIIAKLGLRSWYDFITMLQDSGLDAFKQLSFVDYLWLFLGYPLTLGLGYLIGHRIYNLF